MQTINRLRAGGYEITSDGKTVTARRTRETTMLPNIAAPLINELTTHQADALAALNPAPDPMPEPAPEPAREVDELRAQLAEIMRRINEYGDGADMYEATAINERLRELGYTELPAQTIAAPAPIDPIQAQIDLINSGTLSEIDEAIEIHQLAYMLGARVASDGSTIAGNIRALQRLKETQNADHHI